ncbi:hypothetical protein HAX54_015900, partial [Datura stramonium]|nr:hypothetical protein [Datura stramonium]
LQYKSQAPTTGGVKKSHTSPIIVNLRFARKSISTKEYRLYSTRSFLPDRFMNKPRTSRVCLYFQTNLNFRGHAVLDLQEASMTHLVGLFEDINLCSIHVKRVTIMPKNINLVGICKCSVLSLITSK